MFKGQNPTLELNFYAYKCFAIYFLSLRKNSKGADPQYFKDKVMDVLLCNFREGFSTQCPNLSGRKMEEILRQFMCCLGPS